MTFNLFHETLCTFSHGFYSLPMFLPPFQVVPSSIWYLAGLAPWMDRGREGCLFTSLYSFYVQHLFMYEQ